MMPGNTKPCRLARNKRGQIDRSPTRLLGTASLRALQIFRSDQHHRDVVAIVLRRRQVRIPASVKISNASCRLEGLPSSNTPWSHACPSGPTVVSSRVVVAGSTIGRFVRGLRF